MLHDKILQATTLGCISKPSHFPLPAAMPIYAAVVAVTLPEGCSALDNRLGHRISTGTGWSQDEANYFACIEGIERYSIQYSNKSPEKYKSFASSHGLREFSTDEVLTGSPNGEILVTDIGCAAGPTRDFAMTKAIFEVLEHHHFDQFTSGDLKMLPKNKNLPAEINALSEWLSGQLRVMDIRVSSHHGMYWFAVCACSDLDWGRRTESHGIGITANDAINSAVKEAILFWRNMIELEKRGAPIDGMSTREKTAIKKYRGAFKPHGWPIICQEIVEIDYQPVSTDLDHLIRVTSCEIGKSISLIDLTQKILGVPVVRCQVDA